VTGLSAQSIYHTCPKRFKKHKKMKLVLDESIMFEFLTKNINQLRREYHSICPNNPKNQQRFLQKISFQA